jgi:protein phosphatase
MGEIQSGGSIESAHLAMAPAGGHDLQFHSPVRVEVAGLSHQGKVRSNNEDHFYIGRFGRFLETFQTNLPSEKSMNRSEEASYGMLVADGVGGGSAGEVASREAIHLLLGLVLQAPDWILSPTDEAATEKILQRAATRVAQINQALGQQARADSGLQGFGTTFTASWNLGRRLFIAHVGDSRAYLFRGQALEQLTRDHTFAQELADRGLIASEEVAKHRMRHVLTRALGDTDAAGGPELQQLHLEDGDAVLLCTDGLSDMILDQQIAATLTNAQTCDLACQHLLEQALEAGGKDNITVVLARYRVQP